MLRARVLPHEHLVGIVEPEALDVARAGPVPRAARDAVDDVPQHDGRVPEPHVRVRPPPPGVDEEPQADADVEPHRQGVVRREHPYRTREREERAKDDRHPNQAPDVVEAPVRRARSDVDLTRAERPLRGPAERLLVDELVCVAVENAREEERPDVDYRAHAADQAAPPMQLLVVRPHVAQESAQAGEPGQGVPGAVAHGQKEEGRGGDDDAPAAAREDVVKLDAPLALLQAPMAAHFPRHLTLVLHELFAAAAEVVAAARRAHLRAILTEGFERLAARPPVHEREALPRRHVPRESIHDCYDRHHQIRCPREPKVSEVRQADPRDG